MSNEAVTSEFPFHFAHTHMGADELARHNRRHHLTGASRAESATKAVERIDVSKSFAHNPSSLRRVRQNLRILRRGVHRALAGRGQRAQSYSRARSGLPRAHPSDSRGSR